MISKTDRVGLIIFLIFIIVSTASKAESIAQTLSITTNFKSIVGKPTWLLELRDMESGQVLPYIFDIKNKKDYWVAFSTERSYKVKASVLKFGPYITVNNFCSLENGVLTGKSMTIKVLGSIGPGLKKIRCITNKFNQPTFNLQSARESQ